MRIRGLGNMSRATWSRMLPGQELEDEQDNCVGLRLVRGWHSDGWIRLKGGGKGTQSVIAWMAGNRGGNGVGLRLRREVK